MMTAHAGAAILMARGKGSAPRFPQLGVLEEARRRPGFPGSELAWASDRFSRFALTTLWESTGACSAWQTQQLLPVPRSHPDVVGLGQPGTVDILEVEPGLASAHATSSNGQVAATPALTRGRAARRTAIKASCAVPGCSFSSATQTPGTKTDGRVPTASGPSRWPARPKPPGWSSAWMTTPSAAS
jgi:hypothetical protein